MRAKLRPKKKSKESVNAITPSWNIGKLMKTLIRKA